MIGADDLVSVGDIRFRTEKERAVIAHVLQKIIGIARQNLHVFAGDLIGDPQHLFIGIDQNDLAIIAPGDAGQIRRRQVLELPPDLGFDVFSQRAARRHQYSR